MRIKLQNNVKSCSILKIKHKISVNTKQASGESCVFYYKASVENNHQRGFIMQFIDETCIMTRAPH